MNSRLASVVAFFLTVSSAFTQELSLLEEAALGLRSKDFHQPLALSEAQVQRIDYLLEQVRLKHVSVETDPGIRNASTKPLLLADLAKFRQSAAREIVNTLSPQQSVLLRRAAIKHSGPFVLARADIAQLVGLDANQRRRIDQMRTTAEKQMEGLTLLLNKELAKVPKPQNSKDKAQMAAYRAKQRKIIDDIQIDMELAFRNRQEAEKGVVAMLTANQRQRWFELIAEQPDRPSRDPNRVFRPGGSG
jgi:hypothetical protein